jgi:hypothetical protein
LAGVLLYIRSDHRLANAFMAGLVACIALRFLSNWLIRTGVFMRYPDLSLVIMPLDFAWGPLLYLYAYSISGRTVGPAQLLHFLPSLLMFSAPITFALNSREQQLAFLTYFWSSRENLELGKEVFDNMPAFWRSWVDLHLQGSFFAIQFGAYCYLVLRQIQQHNLSLERHFSFTEQMNLRWLRTLTYLCVLFLLLFLVFNRARLVLFGHFEITALSPNTPFLFLVVAIYGIGIAALYQPTIRTDASRGTGSEAGLSYHQTSQVINGQMNQRFFSFVNNYRIALAKEMLADPKTGKMAIVDLAMEVGFKSKSSFYDAFKKVTQITPTQFKRELETSP